MRTLSRPRALFLCSMVLGPLAPISVIALAGGDCDDEIHDEAIAPMVRPNPGPAPLAKGQVKIEIEGDEQELEIEAEGLTTGHLYFAFMETAVGSGVLVNLGQMGCDGDHDDDWKSHDDDDDDDDNGWGDDDDDDDDDDDNGWGDDDDDDDDDGDGSVELKFESEDGGTGLPFHVASLDQLAMRRVEIRDETNLVYLFGFVPSLTTSTKPDQRTKPLHHPGNGGKGRIRLRKVPLDARHEFEVRVTGIKGHDKVTIVIEDPKTHVMKPVGVIAVANGKAKLRLDTHLGQALPLGCASNDPLAGLDLEVRDTTNGKVLFDGKIPKL